MKKNIQTTFSGLAIALLPFGAIAQGVHIESGAHFMMTGPVNLVISDGALTNDGIFSAGADRNSNLTFMGSAAAAMTNIGGANAVGLQSLTLAKEVNDIQLNRDITVAASVNMGGGNLQLNRHTIDLGATGNINNEGERSRIAGIGGGRVQAKATAIPNTFFGPGTLGLTMLSDKAGTYQVTRQNTVETLPNGMGKSIQSNYSISGPAGVKVSYFAKYLQAELNGNNVQNLVFYVTDRFGNPLTAIGRSSIDTLQEFVSRTDTALFGHITIGPGVVTKLANSPGNTATAKSSLLANGGATAPVSLKVYPNPAHDQVTVDLVSVEGGDRTLSLYDQTGHLLQQRRISCVTGRNTITWDMGKYTPGIYYLSMDRQGAQSIEILKK